MKQHPVPAPFTVDQVAPVLQELEESYFNIPFENSDFQNRAFVAAAQQTPGRAYRAIGLRMFAKIRAVQEHLIQQQRTGIDIEEKEFLIKELGDSQEPMDCFQRRRLELDITQLRTGKSWGDKLLNDALRELATLYAMFKQLPKYTREQFEAEETAHYTARLERQINTHGSGAMEAIANMSDDLENWDLRIEHAVRFMETGGQLNQLGLAGLAVPPQGQVRPQLR